MNSQNSMNSNRIELNSDIAYLLAYDDGLRSRLISNPQDELKKLGVLLDTDYIPEVINLPPKIQLQQMLGFSKPAIPKKKKTSPKHSSKTKGNGLSDNQFARPITERLKRHHLCFVQLKDKYFLDAPSLLSGEFAMYRDQDIVCLNLLTQTEHHLSPEEFEVLYSVPSAQWIRREPLQANLDIDIIDGLIEKKILLTNNGNSDDQAIMQQDLQLSKKPWHPYSALFHYMGKWDTIGEDKDWWQESLIRETKFDNFVSRHGIPPSHFYNLEDTKETINLPLEERETALTKLLQSRKTTRSFDTTKSIPFNDFAYLLKNTFGCHGTADAADGVTMLKKGSPSGGGLHPTEIYPFVLRVEGLKPGIYHYSVENHALELIESIELDEAEILIDTFTAGQTFFHTAGALFIMAARFERNFWKYRNHLKAYRVLLLDAGHLSQTCYLQCAELNLGSFFTAAMNDINIEKRLQINPMEQGITGILGCGIMLEEETSESEALNMNAKPYKPKR